MMTTALRKQYPDLVVAKLPLVKKLGREELIKLIDASFGTSAISYRERGRLVEVATSQIYKQIVDKLTPGTKVIIKEGSKNVHAVCTNSYFLCGTRVVTLEDAPGCYECDMLTLAEEGI